MSEQSKLFPAMAKAFALFEGAKKDAVNPHFNKNYADMASVADAIRPGLVANDLFFVQQVGSTADGVTVETVICHAGGEKFPCGQIYIPALRKDAQGFGSALTYARRYSLMAAFGISPEDDDGNAASVGKAPRAEREVNPVPARQPAEKFDERLDRLGSLPEPAKKALWVAFGDNIEAAYNFADSHVWDSQKICEDLAPKTQLDKGAIEYLRGIPQKIRTHLTAIGHNTPAKILQWARYGEAGEMTYQDMYEQFGDVPK